MSQPFNLPFDEIATVKLLATRASGQPGTIIPGSTVTSDNPAVAVAVQLDPTNTFPVSYTATATVKPTVGTPIAANITLAAPAGSGVPDDVAVCTIVDDAVVSQSQDTANATFAPNPNPPA